ncbi:MAG: MFS transporter [Microthrixaceae bacterium]
MIRSTRVLLGLASVAVAFAAADTYVVVLALPEMMTSVGVPIDELQRAAPIISGFLLGYVAMLPLIGRIADLRGRVPVLVMSLMVFAAGSLITALAYDMSSMVIGRFLQGVGGGGLVPATLALVADLFPVERRGVPLGIVSAVQELGSVAGPLFGAVVLVFADWRAIFAINLAVGLVLAAGIRALAFIPLAGEGRWLTPVGLVAVAAGLLLLARCMTAARPLVDVRGWFRSMVEADLTGALLLAAALGGVILAFATADPEISVFADHGHWYLIGSAAASLALVVHLRRSSRPLVPRGALRRTPAWGAMVVSFFVGSALIAALIDIPLFARTTIYPDSQLMAALVLVRFLVALPVGAVIGGYLLRRVDAGTVTAAGMSLAALGFWLMSRWDITALEHWSSTVALVVAGFGFGLALAPVNAAVLASTDHQVHGLASALVVVARMVGMLVGISALTTIGLRRYYAEQSDLPSVREVCDGASRCEAFTVLLKQAGIAQEQAVFQGAAICALVGAILALVLFRGAQTRGLSTSELVRQAG